MTAGQAVWSTVGVLVLIVLVLVFFSWISVGIQRLADRLMAKEKPVRVQAVRVQAIEAAPEKEDEDA